MFRPRHVRRGLGATPLSHDDPSATALPEGIGPYRVLHQIGSGVFGPVFRAVDPDGDRIVAIKLFRLDWPPEQARALAGALETLIETLPAHPNLVMPLASGLEGGTAWLAQEFVGADSLEARLRRRTPLHAGEAVALLQQAASGLDLAAAAGWRHGALHPRDILVGTAGRVHVTGVGVAQVVERFGARPHRRRPYTAPERAIAAGWDSRADVFALATIASEMLGPRRNRGQSDEARVAAFSEAGFNGRMAAAVLNRGMSNVAGERPASCTDLVDALAATVGVPEEQEARHEDAPAAGATAVSTLFDLPVPGADQPPRTAGAAAPGGPTLGAGHVAAADAAAAAGEARPTGFDTSSAGPAGAGAEAAGPIARDPHEAPGLADWEIDRVPAAAGHVAVPEVDLPADAAPPARGMWEALPEVESGGPEHTFPAADAGQAGGRGTGRPWGALAAVLLVGLAAGFALGRWSAPTVSRPGAAAGEGSTLAQPAAEVRDEAVYTDAERGRVPAPATPTTALSSARPAGPASPGVGAAARPAPAAPVERPASPRARPPSPTAPAPARPAAAGRLLVRTSPAGARVKVDGNDRGVSPLTLRDLALREYAVEVSRTGYAPETRRIRLTERQPTRSLEIALRAASAGAAAASPPGRASLELATRPPGARVYVDGQLIGTTPLRMVDVAPGTKAVSFELTGYAKWTATVTIAPGEPRKVSASLEPLP